jgi:hypothetical protein
MDLAPSRFGVLNVDIPIPRKLLFSYFGSINFLALAVVTVVSCSELSGPTCGGQDLNLPLLMCSSTHAFLTTSVALSRIDHQVEFICALSNDCTHLLFRLKVSYYKKGSF